MSRSVSRTFLIRVVKVIISIFLYRISQYINLFLVIGDQRKQAVSEQNFDSCSFVAMSNCHLQHSYRGLSNNGSSGYTYYALYFRDVISAIITQV